MKLIMYQDEIKKLIAEKFSKELGCKFILNTKKINIIYDNITEEVIADYIIKEEDKQ